MTGETVFLAALDIPDPAARARHLDAACGEDAALRRRVDELLAAHAKSGEFLDVPAGEQAGADAAATRTLPHPPADAAPAGGWADALPFLGPPTRPDSLGRLGHYEVLSVVGRGGFGIVLRAFDDALHRVVAVKVLAPELAATSPARKRFLREARAAAAVRHENVVQTYAVEEQPLPHLVMEYVPGETLQQRIDRTGPLDPAAAARIGAQVARGLAAAHAAGLVHRDVKPANVLLADAGGGEVVKLTDFGLARAADDASLTRSGVIAGTPLYMAPEQARGEDVDARTDLFSLGSVLYVMLTGRPPFRAATTMAVLKRVCDDAPRPIRQVIPEVPGWLCRLVETLHAKDPAGRIATAAAVADELTRVHPPEPPPANPASRRVAASVVVAGLAIATLVAVGVFALTRPREVVQGPPPTTVTPVATPPAATSTPPPKPPDPPGPDDRKAALWALSLGGTVRLNDWGYWINATDLPAGPFRLTGVNLTGNKRLTDAGLSNLRGCPHLRHLYLHQTAVTDDGLAHLKGCPRLNVLLLSDTSVTDSGLAHLLDLKDLAYLQLSSTRVGDRGMPTLARMPRLTSLLVAATGVTDEGLKAFDGRTDLLSLDLCETKATEAGLAHFKACKRLIYLKLQNLPITDTGLEPFGRCEGLESLLLNGTKVTDAGLAPFRKCEHLRNVALTDTRITDAGLAHLQGCTRLESVLLGRAEKSATGITDAGLKPLKTCTNLRHVELRNANVTDAGIAALSRCRLEELFVTGTKVTATGVDELKRLRPRCWIEWNGGTVVPPTPAERTAAEFVLALGGVLRANEPFRDYRAAAGFDRDRGLPHNFSVSSAQLGANAQMTDASMGVFVECGWLAHLDLNRTAVGDAGLIGLTKTGGRRLATLDLTDTRLTGAGVAALDALPDLTHLRLSGTTADDAGLARLKECTRLVFLDLRRTKVTREAVAAFATARPGCRIEWDGDPIEPRDVLQE